MSLPEQAERPMNESNCESFRSIVPLTFVDVPVTEVEDITSFMVVFLDFEADDLVDFLAEEPVAFVEVVSFLALELADFSLSLSFLLLFLLLLLLFFLSLVVEDKEDDFLVEIFSFLAFSSV